MKKVELGIEKRLKDWVEARHNNSKVELLRQSYLRSQILVIGQKVDMKAFRCQIVRMDGNCLDRNSQIIIWCWHYGSSGNGNTVILFLTLTSRVLSFQQPCFSRWPTTTTLLISSPTTVFLLLSLLLLPLVLQMTLRTRLLASASRPLYTLLRIIFLSSKDIQLENVTRV